MDRKKAEEIANFRYRLISPIVCKESLYFGERADLIREAASKIYQIPGSRNTRVSIRTIERYLKQYREGGFEALMPGSVSQRPTRIPQEYFDLAAALKRENLKRPVTQIIEILEMSGKVPKGVLKRSTLYDYFEREGLTKELGKKESKAYQRFSPKHRNQRWQGDMLIPAVFGGRIHRKLSASIVDKRKRRDWYVPPLNRFSSKIKPVCQGVQCLGNSDCINFS